MGREDQAETVRARRQASPSEPTRGRNSRIAFAILAWLLIACVAVQVYLAGIGVFEGRWSDHLNFVHIFEYVPIIMLILSLTGRMRHRVRWLSFAAFAMIWLQYAFVEMDTPAVQALHPVNGMLIFGVAVLLALWGTAAARGGRLKTVAP